MSDPDTQDADWVTVGHHLHRLRCPTVGRSQGYDGPNAGGERTGRDQVSRDQTTHGVTKQNHPATALGGFRPQSLNSTGQVARQLLRRRSDAQPEVVPEPDDGGIEVRLAGAVVNLRRPRPACNPSASQELFVAMQGSPEAAYAPVPEEPTRCQRLVVDEGRDSFRV